MRILTMTLALALAGTASADLVNPDVPAWRGQPGTMFSQWDSFSSAVNAPNFPEAGGGFQLFNFGEGAVVASSGNIYNPAGGLNIHVYSLGPVVGEEAVLNISWGGTMLDTTDVQAFFGGEYIDAYSVEQRASTPSPFGGTTDTWAFKFDLSGISGASDLAFFFGNDGPHGSLDAVSLDLNMVPAPGALALLGMAGVAARRRRR